MIEFLDKNALAHQELSRAIQRVTEEKEEWVSIKELYREVRHVFDLGSAWVDDELKSLSKAQHLIKDFNKDKGNLILWRRN